MTRLVWFVLLATSMAFAQMPGFPTRGAAPAAASAPIFSWEGQRQAAPMTRCLYAPLSGGTFAFLGTATVPGAAPASAGTPFGATAYTLSGTNVWTSSSRFETWFNTTTQFQGAIWAGTGAPATSGFATSNDTDAGQSWGANVLLRWGFSGTAVSGSWPSFAGLRANLDGGTNCRTPESMPNSAYVGCSEGATSMSACTNDGTGSATCVALGADFPCASVAGAMFSAFITTTETSVTFNVENLDTGVVAEVTATTDLPTPSAVLGFDISLCGDAGSGSPKLGVSLVCFGGP